MSTTTTATHLAPTTHTARAARAAGIGYVAMFILAIGANFGVRNQIVVADDPGATLANISQHEGAFRLGLAAFAIIAVLDMIIAWALYVYLRDLAPHRSLLAAWLRLAYGAILAVAVGFMYLALVLATNPGRFEGLDLGQRESLAALAMDGFDIVWLLGLVVFGLHLIAVGSILVTTRVAPRALGTVLAFAGAAYVVDTFAHLLMPDYAAVADLMLVDRRPAVDGRGDVVRGMAPRSRPSRRAVGHGWRRVSLTAPRALMRVARRPSCPPCRGS